MDNSSEDHEEQTLLTVDTELTSTPDEQKCYETANESNHVEIIGTDVLQQVHSIISQVQQVGGNESQNLEAISLNSQTHDIDRLLSVSQMLQNSDTGFINLRTEDGETITIQLSTEENLPSSHDGNNSASVSSQIVVDNHALPSSESFVPEPEVSKSDVDDKVDNLDSDHVNNGVLNDLEQVMDECFNKDPSQIPQPKIIENPFLTGLQRPYKKKPKILVKPDLTNPISLSEDTLVVVNGKKCFLRRDPQSGQMVAYPAKQDPLPGQKKRGRPRKSERHVHSTCRTIMIKTPDDVKSCEPAKDENSAVQGLLELSNIGPDGLRRSCRPRKKAKIFEEYELGKVASDESDVEIDETAEILENDDDQEWSEEVEHLDPNKEQAFDAKEDKIMETSEYVDVQDEKAVKRGPGRPRVHPQRPPPPPGAVKRGRGRPRRVTSPSADEDLTNPMPAYVIDLPNNGVTVILAPKGLKTNELPVTTPVDAGQTCFAIVTPEGSHREIRVNVTGLVKIVQPSPHLNINCETIGEENTETPQKSDVECSQGEVKMEAQKEVKLEVITVSANEIRKSEFPELTNSDGEKVQPTMIQMPKKMMSLLMPQKTPVRLGLKTNEDYLNKLRCQLCDFQAYFSHQYQDHLFKSHASQLTKCRCCSFITFDKDSLTSHYLQDHPRNICHVCNFTADYAYVIKRHMMRHDEKGCICNVCGKRYKDTYILKMHYKMVHLPAEVLFECNVCGKKFTRKAHLKRHLRIHAPLKPFKCDLCDYRGCEKSDLTKHMLVHEAPQHSCEVCGKPFRHIKNKELHLKRHSGQRDFKCGLCEFYGYTFTDIRKHIERIHSESRVLDFVCDKCGNIFKTENDLKEHTQSCDMNLVDFTNSDSTYQSVSGQQIIMQGSSGEMAAGQTCITLDDGRVIDATELARLASEGGNLFEAVEYQLAANHIEQQEHIESVGETHQLESGIIDSTSNANVAIVETIEFVDDLPSGSRSNRTQQVQLVTLHSEDQSGHQSSPVDAVE